MPVDRQHLSEGASVQVTPAQPDPSTAAPSAPAPELTQEETPAVTPNKTGVLKRLLGVLGALMLVALVACSPNIQPANPNEAAGLGDDAQVSMATRPEWVPSNVAYVHIPSPLEEPTKYRVRIDVAKCFGDVAVCTPGAAYEVRSAEQNLLMTAGATALWNGLSTAGLGTPFSTTNAQLAVGDATTGESASQTDLQAAVGTKINAADVTSCTNATPIVCSGTYSPAAVAGQVYKFSGFSGAGASAINNTFEASAGSSSSITLLNSAGSGSITVTGGIIQPLNYYRQQANASGSAVVTTNSIVYVATFGTTNANFHWQEWGLSTGAAATNKEAQAPPTLFNRKVVDLGTKTSAASWTLTVTLSLS